MRGCPYTWFKTLLGSPGKSRHPTGSSERTATFLRVTVTRDTQRTVDVALPADSARWLIDLIPEEVLQKIRTEGIPIEAIQRDLAERKELTPHRIFSLTETLRAIEVWLE